METLECDQCSIVKMNTILQNALIDFMISVRECCLLKGIFVREEKINHNKSNFMISVIRTGREFDELVFESCKNIFKVLKDLTGIDVSVNILNENQLTELQLDSIEDDNGIIYESVSSYDTINETECLNDINKNIQYVKKR